MNTDLRVATDETSTDIVRRRIRIVRHHGIRIHENKIANGRTLSKMHIAVQAAKLSELRLTLNIRQCPHGTGFTNCCVLPDCDAMTRGKMRTYRAGGVNNCVTPDDRVCTDDGRWIHIRRIGVIRIQRFADDAVVADRRIVTDHDVIVDGAIISYPNIFPNLCAGTHENISPVEFHSVFWLASMRAMTQSRRPIDPIESLRTASNNICSSRCQSRRLDVR